ncbi:hypothetical protein C1H46_021612 [Malus baccata]|uniref:Uncharacterized protein n=1 Tax=Malus baccata TaxID=106549 RepID=A0A540M254_MALBA|nr:hypothetical protein C1H46_021612 [Malus baccata]
MCHLLCGPHSFWSDLRTEFFFDERGVLSLGPAWISQASIAAKSNMLKANPGFCILGHFIIIGVCFGISIKVSGKTIINPSLLLLECQSIHQLLIDSNNGFNHEIGNGHQPQHMPPNFPFHKEALVHPHSLMGHLSMDA